MNTTIAVRPTNLKKTNQRKTNASIRQAAPKITINENFNQRPRRRVNRRRSLAIPRNRFAPVRSRALAVPRRNMVRALGLTDSQVVHGTPLLLDTLFSGVGGISQGIAFGSDPSALTKFKGTFDVTLTTAGGLNLAMCPAAVQAGNWIILQNYDADAPSAPGPGQSPYGSGTGITNTAVVGPFNATNPSLGWRVVRCALRVTTVTNVLNMGGYINAAHIPIMYTGAPVAGTYVMPTTNSDLQNTEIQRTFAGVDPMIYQWFPNQNEVDIKATNYYTASTNAGLSGLYLAIKAPDASGCSYHFEWEVGIEYIPNAAYKPFVLRKLTDVHPDAIYFMNQFVAKHWISCVLTTLTEWKKLVEAMDPMVHSHTDAFSIVNKVGFGSDYGKFATQNEPGLLNRAFDFVSDAMDMSGDQAIYEGYRRFNTRGTRIEPGHRYRAAVVPVLGKDWDALD